MFICTKTLERIERIELLDMENENFAIPTTLAIADGCLYVVANSQLLNLDQKKLAITILIFWPLR